MGDYHDHYFKKDALLFQKRKIYWRLLKILGIRSWPLFQFSRIKLGCNVKNDWHKIRKNIRHYKYLFIEKGFREGISYIVKRCAKANNKYTENYDPKKLSTFITYLDMNNLYG